LFRQPNKGVLTRAHMSCDMLGTGKGSLAHRTFVVPSHVGVKELDDGRREIAC